MGSRQKSAKKLIRLLAKKRQKSNKKKFLFERDGGKCFWCQRDLILTPDLDGLSPLSEAEMTLDHVIPKSKGGTGDRNNLVISCQKCNTTKASSLLNPQTKLPISPHVISVMLKGKEALLCSV